MKNVKVKQSILVEATSSHYLKGWEGEVSDEIAKRHGKEGTGFLEVLPKIKETK